MKDLVSIVMPTYNRSHIIRKAIESCLNQTYKNIELIIVNDGSWDNTSEVVKKYFKDKRVKYFEQENMGVPDALNHGFQMAKGEYFTWISDDNYFKENAIEIMLNEIVKHKEPIFVYTNIDLYFKDTNETKLLDLSVDNSLYIENCIGACFLYPRIIAETIGGYSREYKLAEDYEYWLRVDERFPMIHVNESPYVYTLHGNSLTNLRKNEQSAVLSNLFKRYNLFTKLIEEIKLYSQDREYYIWGTGTGAISFYEKLILEDILEIKGFIDGTNKANENFLDKEVFSPIQFQERIISSKSKPYILIASRFREEITKELDRMELISKEDYFFVYNSWV